MIRPQEPTFSPDATGADGPPAPIVDPVMIEQLRDLDAGAGEVLVELVEMFVADLAGHLAEISAAADRNDHVAIARAAHAVAGSAANIGARRLSGTARALERATTAGRATGSPGIEDLRREAQIAVSVLAHPTVSGRAVDITSVLGAAAA